MFLIAMFGFVVTLLICGTVNHFCFERGTNGRLKRSVFPAYDIAISVAFLSFLALALVTAKDSFNRVISSVMLVTFLGASVYYAMRFSTFCLACGAMVRSRKLAEPVTVCPDCGAHLGQNPTAHE